MAEVEDTRVVVEADETYDGTIIPTVRAELDRPVRIRSGATVEGSCYGGEVELDDDTTVEGSVMASDAVEVEGGYVTGEVGTPGRVVARDARIDGTVTGTRIRLQNTVVRGNVVGTEVILENCVVLGIVGTERRLTAEDTLCYTLRSETEAVLDGVTVVLPQAVVDGDVTLETPVEVAGLGEVETAAAGNAERAGDGSTDGDGEADDGDAGSLPEMTRSDLTTNDGTTYLTLAPRLLDLEAVSDRLDELESAVLQAVDDTSGDDGTDLTVADVLDMLDVDSDLARQGRS